MPSESQPFNSIGQIIESGGLRSVAVILSHGGGEQRATHYLQRNFTGINQSAADEVIRRARAASEAGRRLTELVSLTGRSSQDVAATAVRLATEAGQPISIVVNRDASGRFIRATEFSNVQTLDLADIPVEPELFGSESGGARIDLSADLLSGDGNHLARVDFELVGDETLQDLMDMMPDYMQRWLDKSPKSFHDRAQENLDELLIEFTYVARKF